MKKLKLHGFNNLTKSLSFCIYDICYAKTAEERDGYIAYIDELYNANRLTEILSETCSIIGANILNIARQDYEPQGASVTILVSEEPIDPQLIDQSEHPGPLPETVVAHLDKSHICVHTYPESHPEGGLCTFRADIEVSTCGVISPLKALNYLIHQLESDIVTIDYRVRGFTRDINGMKHFIDHEINSIQNFMSEDMKSLYDMVDVNVYQENMFHTKMMLKEFDLKHYMFHTKPEELSEPRAQGDYRPAVERDAGNLLRPQYPCGVMPEMPGGAFACRAYGVPHRPAPNESLTLLHKFTVCGNHLQEILHTAKRGSLRRSNSSPLPFHRRKIPVGWRGSSLLRHPATTYIHGRPVAERSLPFTVRAACSTSSRKARLSFTSSLNQCPIASWSIDIRTFTTPVISRRNS